MSTVVVEAGDLYNCFSALALLAPKGGTDFPVNISLSEFGLRFRCLIGCAFEGTIPAVSKDIQNKTILWYDVTPILPRTGKILVGIESNYVKLIAHDVECTFALGYSDIVEFDLTKQNYVRIQVNGYEDGFRSIQSLGLDKLYGKVLPVHVYKDLAVVKYPCTYVQVRTTGFPFTATLDQEHIKMITRFKPEEVALEQESGSLIFKRRNTMIQVPCRLDVEANDFTSYMKDMQIVCRASLGGFAEKFANASKVSSKSDCKVILYTQGMKTEINMGVASSVLSVGDTSGEVIKAFQFPVQPLLAFFRTLGDNLAEVLVGGELLCLRTQTLIILTRVLY